MSKQNTKHELYTKNTALNQLDTTTISIDYRF